VQSGIELADADGLAAVSMKRVAERLGFTTMSLYCHVAGKDELLLRMQDTVGQPPSGLDEPVASWRGGLAQWTRQQFVIMELHPWLDEVRLIERAGTPSQIAWIDLGLRPLAGVLLSEYQKVAVLLLLSGYVSTQARLAATTRDGAARGLFAPDDATEAFGELLRTVVEAERFPALRRALEGGAFAPQEGDLYASFDLGLELMLDGVERLIEREAAG
jgi:AcrR family transcriptional regulator